VQFSDDTYSEERAIDKLFRCIPEKYKQIARLIESLLDLYMVLIEEMIGRLKVVNGDEPQPLSEPITIGGKLHLTQDSERPARVTERMGSPLPRQVVASAVSRARSVEAPRSGCEDVSRVAPTEALRAAPPATRSRHETTPATTMASLAIGPRSVDSHDVARPTSHRRRRRRSRLCSWHTQASSYLQRHWPQRLLHLDEPRAHVLLGDGLSNDKINGWCLDTGATHHMTYRTGFLH
jgi:hypothetical protein